MLYRGYICNPIKVNWNSRSSSSDLQSSALDSSKSKVQQGLGMFNMCRSCSKCGMTPSKQSVGSLLLFAQALNLFVVVLGLEIRLLAACIDAGKDSYEHFCFQLNDGVSRPCRKGWNIDRNVFPHSPKPGQTSEAQQN